MKKRQEKQKNRRWSRWKAGDGEEEKKRRY